jgi:hypothetical protein
MKADRIAVSTVVANPRRGLSKTERIGVEAARYHAAMFRLLGKRAESAKWTEEADRIAAGHEPTLEPPERAARVPKAAPEPSRVETQHGHIYVVRVRRYVKIGFTRNVRNRMGNLQTANPDKIEIVATFAGSTDDELSLHARFAAFREIGEWFREEGDLADWIKGGCSP